MIKYFVMDVDGTLTDGKLYISNTGEFMKVFSIKDGCGIQEILLPTGIIPIVITGRISEIVRIRCKENGITEVHQGVTNKLEKLKEVVNNDLANVAYIGDDINDLHCIETIKECGGIVGCPADAVFRVKEKADYISPYNGGDGAVRDFIEWVVSV